MQIALAEWNRRLDEDAAWLRLEALLRQAAEAERIAKVKQEADRKAAEKAKRKAAAAEREKQRKALQEIAKQARIDHWLKMVGLPPPDERPFTPCQDPVPKVRAVSVDDLPIQKRPTQWALPATMEDSDPMWHNVVRAYEEDR